MIIKRLQDTLSNTFNIEVGLAHDTCPADINAIDSHKGIGDWLTSISEQGVGETVGYDFHGHPGFNADAIHLGHSLGGNAKSRHSISVLVVFLCRQLPRYGQKYKKRSGAKCSSY